MTCHNYISQPSSINWKEVLLHQSCSGGLAFIYCTTLVPKLPYDTYCIHPLALCPCSDVLVSILPKVIYPTYCIHPLALCLCSDVLVSILPKVIYPTYCIHPLALCPCGDVLVSILPKVIYPHTVFIHLPTVRVVMCWYPSCLKYCHLLYPRSAFHIAGWQGSLVVSVRDIARTVLYNIFSLWRVPLDYIMCMTVPWHVHKCSKFMTLSVHELTLVLCISKQ